MGAVALSEAVVGLRGWQAGDDGRLVSIHCPAQWEPGVTRARCFDDPGAGIIRHTAPDPYCTCGLYAYSDLNYRERVLFERPNIVVGTVAAWGQVEPDGGSFRAEQARILAIGRYRVPTRQQRRAAWRYGVPLLPFTELAGFSYEHGRPFDATGEPPRTLTLVIDCGPTATGLMDEIRWFCHSLVQHGRYDETNLVACGRTASFVPIGAAGDDERSRRFGQALEMLIPDQEGPALARGVERARGQALAADRAWSSDLVVIATQPPDAETCWQLDRAHTEGTSVITVSPPARRGGRKEPIAGAHIPIRRGVPGEITRAAQDVTGRLAK
jgi:hypothetical protein